MDFRWLVFCWLVFVGCKPCYWFRRKELRYVLRYKADLCPCIHARLSVWAFKQEARSGNQREQVKIGRSSSGVNWKLTAHRVGLPKEGKFGRGWLLEEAEGFFIVGD